MMDVTATPEFSPVNQFGRKKRSFSPASSHGAPAAGFFFGAGSSSTAGPLSPGRSKMTRIGLKTVSPWSSNRQPSAAAAGGDGAASASYSRGCSPPTGMGTAGDHHRSSNPPVTRQEEQEQQPPPGAAATGFGATSDETANDHVETFKLVSSSNSMKPHPPSSSARAGHTAASGTTAATKAATSPATLPNFDGPFGDTHRAEMKWEAAEAAAAAGGLPRNFSFNHSDSSCPGLPGADTGGGGEGKARAGSRGASSSFISTDKPRNSWFGGFVPILSSSTNNSNSTCGSTSYGSGMEVDTGGDSRCSFSRRASAAFGVMGGGSGARAVTYGNDNDSRAAVLAAARLAAQAATTAVPGGAAGGGVMHKLFGSSNSNNNMDEDDNNMDLSGHDGGNVGGGGEGGNGRSPMA